MKIIKALVCLLLAVALFFCAWYYRPWSEYSPAKIASLEEPEALVHNFRNMIELMPGVTVPKGSTTSGLIYSESSPLEFEYEFESQKKTLSRFISESTTTGLLVIKDGQIQFENYYTGADETSLFTSWSVAKSFVATAIAMAHKEGLIESLDDPADKYVPTFSGTDFGATSINGLLAMSSGIDFDENYASESSDIRPYFFDSFILGKDPDHLLQPFQRTRQELSDFHYISPNSHVLSAVLRAVYEKPLAQIISEKIWQPLGMEADAIWLHHKAGDDGVALGYCCLNARLRDYARFGLFYLEAFKGEGLGSEVLPKTWVQSLNKPATEKHRPGLGNYSDRGYSWHFWLPPAQPGVFFAAGVYGQYIWIDPIENMVIVRTSADPEWTPRFTETAEVMKAITAQFQN